MVNYQKKISFSKLDQELVNIFKEIEKLKLPKGFLDFVNYCFSELFVNVKEHSKAKIVSVKISINKKNCLVEIEDDGIGLRESYIQKKIYPKDGFAAIEFALSGLSTKDFQERGFGLYSIRKLVNVLKGEMIIESDFSRVIIKENKLAPKKISKQIQGVKIIFNVPIKSIDLYKAVE